MIRIRFTLLLLAASMQVLAEDNRLTLTLVEPTPVVEAGDSVKLRLSLGTLDREQLRTQINHVPGAAMRQSVFDFKGSAYPLNYEFHVTLDQVGEQVIGPLTLDWQGKTWTTNPVTVTVTPVNSQFIPGSLVIQLYPDAGHKRGDQVQVKVSHMSLEHGALEIQLHPDLEHSTTGWTQTRQTALVDQQYTYRHTVSFKVSCDQAQITIDQSWFKALPDHLEVQPQTIHCD